MPSVDDAEVTVQACVVGPGGEPCAHSYDIEVENCGEHRVYRLHTPERCPETYCLGNVGQIFSFLWNTAYVKLSKCTLRILVGCKHL